MKNKVIVRIVVWMTVALIIALVWIAVDFLNERKREDRKRWVDDILGPEEGRHYKSR